jgi:hypothetical protein
MSRLVGSEPAALAHVRQLPFVKRLRYLPLVKDVRAEYDGTLTVETPQREFQMLVEEKNTALSHQEIARLIAWFKHLHTPNTPVMLLTRHISRPGAQALIDAEVNFADEAGNIHLRLGDNYSWTAIGLPPRERLSMRRSITPAQLQLLVQFVTHPESVNWSVRQLEPAAGISKSKAAQARQQVIAEGLLFKKGAGYQLGPKQLLGERLVDGYAKVLRPKLLLGRYRAPEKTSEAFLERLATTQNLRYALTGNDAAYLLQRYYRAPDTTLFIELPSATIAQELRLLPDREGPITLLRSFGEVVFWEARGGHTLAPPWLIYAELRHSDDPRAQEAAQELQQELLA